MPAIPETWLGQFTVNTTTSGSQSQPTVTQLANGNILVGWVSDNDTGPGSPAGTDIIGQLYDPLGNPIGGEFRLNTAGTADAERDAELAAMPGGGFLMVYEDFFNDTTIRLQEYNSAGTSTNSAVVVFDEIAGSPGADNPDVAVSSATSALVVYENGPTATSAIVGRIYNPATNTLAGQFNLMAGGDYRNPVVARLSNGNYVVVAESENGVDDVLRFRVVDPTGGSIVPNSAINGTAGDGFSQREASVTGLSNGNFVVAFTNPDANDTDIRYVIYQNNGTFVTSGNAGLNPGSSTNNNNEPEVTALADGGFVIVIDNDQAGRLEIAHVNNAGAVQGTAVINASGVTPRIVSLADGRFAVAWRDQNSPGEIHMQIMDTRDNANNTLVYTPDNWQVGTVGDDVFTAQVSSEVVHGWDGNDTITEAGIVKQYYGGDGDDVIKVMSPINSDFHDGGAGNDTIDWSGSSASGATFDLDAGTAVQGGSSEQMVGFENVIGTANNDKILGDAGDNRLEGGDGNDVLNGRAGADMMIGGNGDDKYRVNDPGDEVVEVAGGGYDRVDSTISFAIGNRDIERLDLVGDTAIDGTGNKLDNHMVGNDKANVLNGYKGNDFITGRKGADTLNGGAGNDTLVGARGNDILVGGKGKDTLTGSQGADVFVFKGIKQSTVATSGRDTITDFSRAEGDKIDLSVIDARKGGGNQAFTFIGDSDFSGKRGELRYFFAGGSTFIHADKNGDGNADFAIEVADIFNFIASDFVL